MRLRIVLKDELVQAARECSGVDDISALVHEGLRDLVARAASLNLPEAVSEGSSCDEHDIAED
jgi:Arc/MetJ family transcription regulator